MYSVKVVKIVTRQESRSDWSVAAAYWLLSSCSVSAANVPTAHTHALPLPMLPCKYTLLCESCKSCRTTEKPIRQVGCCWPEWC